MQTYEPAEPVLGISMKKMKSTYNTDACISMFTDIIYNIQIYIQLQSWIKEIWYIFLCAHTHTHKIVAVFNHK